MATCETVKVKSDNEQGFIVINKSDLTDKQELFKDAQPKKKAAKKAVTK